MAHDPRSLPAADAAVRAAATSGAAVDSATTRTIAVGAASGTVTVELLTLALTLALGALPAPDLHCALLLLPPASTTDAAVAALADAEAALSSGEFARFWAASKTAPLREALARAPAVLDRIRGFILQTMARTYARVDLATLTAALDLADPIAAATAAGWSVLDKDAGILAAPPSADNTARGAGVGPAAAAGLKYSDVASLVHTLSK